MFESIKSHLQMFISSRAKLPSILLIFMLLMIMVMQQHREEEDDVVSTGWMGEFMTTRSRQTLITFKCFSPKKQK